MEEKIHFLKKIPLLANLTQEELVDIAKISYIKKYKKHAPIIWEEEPGNRLFIVKRGLVKIFSTLPNGRTKTLALLPEGDFFGEMSILDEEPRSASAQALEESEVLVINKADFEHKLRGDTEMAMRIVRTLSHRLRLANREIADLISKDLSSRVAQTLLNLAKRYGERTEEGTRLKKRFTHQEIANLVGAARESVSKVLSNFRDAGSITIKGRTIIIKDEKILSNWTSKIF